MAAIQTREKEEEEKSENKERNKCEILFFVLRSLCFYIFYFNYYLFCFAKKKRIMKKVPEFGLFPYLGL